MTHQRHPTAVSMEGKNNHNDFIALTICAISEITLLSEQCSCPTGVVKSAVVLKWFEMF